MRRARWPEKCAGNSRTMSLRFAPFIGSITCESGANGRSWSSKKSHGRCGDFLRPPCPAYDRENSGPCDLVSRRSGPPPQLRLPKIWVTYPPAVEFVGRAELLGGCCHSTTRSFAAPTLSRRSPVSAGCFWALLRSAFTIVLYSEELSKTGGLVGGVGLIRLFI